MTPERWQHIKVLLQSALERKPLERNDFLDQACSNDPSFEGWSWSRDGKRLAGIKHLPNGVHSGIGIYDMESKNYDCLTDFGDWPVWLK